MDPISLTLGIVGLGTSLFGGFSGASASKQYAQQSAALSQQITQNELQQNAVRQQAMEMSARRNQLEVLRNTQRARAQGLNAAVNQGAQYGSGTAGGLAEVTNEGAFGVQGVRNELQLGESMFGLTNSLTGLRGQFAQLQSQYQSTEATDQGIASLGGALMKSGPMIGNLMGGGKGMGNLFGNMTKGFTSWTG